MNPSFNGGHFIIESTVFRGEAFQHGLVMMPPLVKSVTNSFRLWKLTSSTKLQKTAFSDNVNDHAHRVRGVFVCLVFYCATL